MISQTKFKESQFNKNRGNFNTINDYFGGAGAEIAQKPAKPKFGHWRASPSTKSAKQYATLNKFPEYIEEKKSGKK